MRQWPVSRGHVVDQARLADPRCHQQASRASPARNQRPKAVGILPVLVTLLLGSAAFVALALLLAGTVRAEAVLAIANLVWVLLLGLGLLFPTDLLPGALATLAALLPSGALGDAMRATVVDGGWPWGQWAVLVAWGVVAGALARRFFRWSD